jgi:hypothetical protein
VIPARELQGGRSPVMNESEHVKMQAARVLEHIRMLNEHYGAVISTSDPQLSESLTNAAAALSRFVAEAATEAAGEPAPSE